MTAALQPSDLRINALSRPRLISDVPRFSWKNTCFSSGTCVQLAYEITVLKGEDIVWTSDRVDSQDQFEIRGDLDPLQPLCDYRWKVAVWSKPDDAQGDSTRLESRLEPFSTGLFGSSARWQATWITRKSILQLKDQSALYLRSPPIALSAKPIDKATAYVSALGWYKLFVNGTDKVGPQLLPRCTAFDQSVEYNSFDITQDLLANREPVFTLVVGDGKFRGSLGAVSKKNVYGDATAGWLEVKITYQDGTLATVTTDDKWWAGAGPILASDPKDGETVDLELEESDWSSWIAGAEMPSKGDSARILGDPRMLVPEQVEPVQSIEEVRPVSVGLSPAGKILVDFGRNLVGHVRARLPAGKGKEVTLTFSEVLTKAGEINNNYLLPLHDSLSFLWPLSPQVDRIRLGTRPHEWQPYFTIHGFRWMEIDGPIELVSSITADDLVGIVMSSNLRLQSSFSCSHDGLNALHRNVVASLRGNFTDTPTDCPTRERSGWTGDIQVFSPTAMILVDSEAFLNRYLDNTAREQFPDGRVPHIIPAEVSEFSGGYDWVGRTLSSSAGWGDASVIIPWNMWIYTGKRSILERHYAMGTKWVAYLEKRAAGQSAWGRIFRKKSVAIEQYIVDTGFHWGEWLRPGETTFFWSLHNLLTQGAVVATAYLAHSSRILSKIATLTDRPDDAKRYHELSENTRAAWRAVFVASNGRIGEDKQDDYVRALAFDLVLPEDRPRTLQRLVNLIEKNHNCLGTGFLSTPFLLQTLCENGRPDVAMRVLLQRQTPSWLAQIELGATSIWESWEGHSPDGSPFLSHNHYAFGAVVQFLYENVAGISPLEPGYKRIKICPLVSTDLTHASAHVETPFGRVSSQWTLDATNRIELHIEIPPQCTAEVWLGGAKMSEVNAGQHQFTASR